MYLWTRKFSLNFVSLIRDPNPDCQYGFWIRTGFATAEFCVLRVLLLVLFSFVYLSTDSLALKRKKITLRAVVRWLFCF